MRVDNPDVILIRCVLKHEELLHDQPNAKAELNIQLHRLRDVSDIADRVGVWLSEIVASSQIAYTDFRLLYKNQIISKSVSLEQAGIVEDAQVYLQLVESMQETTQ